MKYFDTVRISYHHQIKEMEISVDTAQEMKFFVGEFFSKRDKILMKLWIWSYLLEKPLTENFNFLCSAKILEIKSVQRNTKEHFQQNQQEKNKWRSV